MDDEEAMAYIARRRACGCVVGAVMDRPEMADDVIEAVTAWMRDGCVIERVDPEYVREHWRACEHDSRQLALDMAGGG